MNNFNLLVVRLLICVILAVFMKNTIASCGFGHDFREIKIEIRETKSTVTLHLPVDAPVNLHTDTLVFAVEYPGLKLIPPWSDLKQHVVNLVVDGGGVHTTFADVVLRSKKLVLVKTDGPVRTYQAESKTSKEVISVFADANKSPVVFVDGSPSSLAYDYYHQLPSGLGVRGQVSKTIGASFEDIDLAISKLINDSICH